MIIVTGMPGAGKDEFIFVARELGMKDVHMGDTVRRYANENDIEVNDHQIGAFATNERKKHGMGIWAERTSQYVEDPQNTIVDGLRNYEELEYFKNEFPDLCVVAIFANRKDRLERILKRDRADDIRTLEELIARDERELSWGIGNVICLSDYMIVNNSTLENFRKNVENFLKDTILCQ